MFCLKCGYKLKHESTRCLNCGENVSEFEYCGGFWGLVGNKKTENESEDGCVDKALGMEDKSENGGEGRVHIKEDESENGGGGKVTEQNKIANFWMLVVAVLILFGIVQTFRVNYYHKEYISLKHIEETGSVSQNECSPLELEYQAVQREKTELQEQGGRCGRSVNGDVFEYNSKLERYTNYGIDENNYKRRIKSNGK